MNVERPSDLMTIADAARRLGRPERWVAWAVNSERVTRYALEAGQKSDGTRAKTLVSLTECQQYLRDRHTGTGTADADTTDTGTAQ